MYIAEYRDTMVPFRREEHNFNSSIPSLSLLSSSDSQLSYYHVEDEATHMNYQNNKRPTLDAKIRKRVSFSEYSVLRLIPGIGCYSDDEREAMFLTGEDMERIKKENDRTIEEIRKGILPDMASECFRGLECKGNINLCNQKRAMREITVSLIISEQEHCHEICPDWIENVYCTITKDSVAKANQMASLDAQSVLNDITV
jgi:hypothetical protein